MRELDISKSHGVLKYYSAFIFMDQAISQLWKKCGITHNSGTGLWMAAEGSVGYCSGTDCRTLEKMKAL
jgi:hypothetical protein